MPFFVPVAALAGSTVVRVVVGGTVVYLLGKQVAGEVNEDIGEKIEDFENAIVEAGGNVIVGAGAEFLDIIEGLGGAIVRGVDGAYDAVRDKLRGKEPDVIAGLVIASLSIMTVVYLYHSAKYARDAF